MQMIKNRRGATVLSIGIAVVIMLIIVSTITFNAVNKFSVQKLDNLYNDIRMLKEKVEIYYLRYGKLPVSMQYTSIASIPTELLNPIDGEKYFILNVNALENISLSTDINDESFFVINEQSHTIYYPKGIEVEGTLYYKLPEQYSKVYTQAELDKIAAEEAERLQRLTLITEWTIPADGTQIQLPVYGNMNITVNWGDGSATETFVQNLANTANFPVHTYATAGTYDVQVIGDCQQFGYFSNNAPTTSSNKDYYSFTQYVTKVKSWGTLGYTRMRFF